MEELNVDIPRFNNLGEWSQRLIKFTKLRKLGIYQVFDTTEISNDTLKYLENVSIEELTIRASLSSIHPLAFHYFTKLKTLDIDMRRPSYGNRISLIVFSPALTGLRNTQIEKLILSQFGYNEDGMILNDTFCGNLVLPYLTDLQLDHGGIYDIRSDLETGCFSNLTNLRMLNLSFNHMSLSRINLYDSIGEISNPFELDISHQNAITEYDDKGLLWLSLPTQI